MSVEEREKRGRVRERVKNVVFSDILMQCRKFELIPTKSFEL